MIATAATLTNLRGWAPLVAVELEYSLLQRATERELLPMAEGFGLGVLAWSPLAGGLLTGKYRNGETGRATALKGSIPYEGSSLSEKVLDELFAIANETSTNPGQVALAWTMSKGVIPVIGPRTQTQLADNLKASELQLSPSQIDRLDQASVIRQRYPYDLIYLS
nr:aldo/keto reductase [Siphonobacter sp. BAB-5405]